MLRVAGAITRHLAGRWAAVGPQDPSWPVWVALLQPQMTLVLQVPRLCSEGLALVPLLKEPRATGCSGSSRRCHCRHFF